MGSSSKKSGGGSAATAAPATPDATATNLPGGVTPQYYSNPANVPTTGGLVLPSVGAGGPMQGAGLNWYTPPPVTRSTLTKVISGGGSGSNYQDNYGRGARGMSGAYGNSSRSGRSNDR